MGLLALLRLGFAPRRRERSIFEHVRALVRRGREPWDDGLPDEEQVDGARFFPGAKDGIATHHMAPTPDAAGAAHLALRIDAWCRSPDGGTAAAAKAAAREANVLAVVEPLLERVRLLPRKPVRKLARRWMTRSRDRNVVKLGITLLGVAGDARDLGVVQLLARHDEFTLYGAVALLRLAGPRWEQELFALARHVHGWGRIHAVERLAETEDEAIRRWLVREGFRNAVMNEYLAWTCAVSGGLLAELQREDPDEALLLGTGEILTALLRRGGPARGIDDYPDGAAAIEAFVGHLGARVPDARQHEPLQAIRDALADPAADAWARQWPVPQRDRLLAACDESLARLPATLR